MYLLIMIVTRDMPALLGVGTVLGTALSDDLIHPVHVAGDAGVHGGVALGTPVSPGGHADTLPRPCVLSLVAQGSTGVSL